MSVVLTPVIFSGICLWPQRGNVCCLLIHADGHKMSNAVFSAGTPHSGFGYLTQCTWWLGMLASECLRISLFACRTQPPGRIYAFYDTFEIINSSYATE